MHKITFIQDLWFKQIYKKIRLTLYICTMHFFLIQYYWVTSILAQHKVGTKSARPRLNIIKRISSGKYSRYSLECFFLFGYTPLIKFSLSCLSFHNYIYWKEIYNGVKPLKTTILISKLKVPFEVHFVS